MKELLLRAGTCGLVGGLGSAVLFGDSGNIYFQGIGVPTNLVIGGAIASGSIVSDVLKENVIEKFNLPQNIKTTEELLIETGLCGLGATTVLWAAGMPTSNAIPTFLWGGASKHIGNYSYDKLLSPQTGMIPIF